MSLLLSFIGHQVIKILENELEKYAPEIQEEFINEINNITNEVFLWVNNKLNNKIGE